MFRSHAAYLEVIHTPGSESRSIDLLVAQRGWIATAGLLTGATVDSILQAQGVNLVCSALDAIRELGRVWSKLESDWISPIQIRPAIIGDDVLVAGVLETQVYDTVGSLQYFGLVNVTSVNILIRQ